MANQQKISYVSDLFEKLQNNPQIVLVSFGATKHKQLEDFRKKLRAGEQSPLFIVLKNSLFKIAFNKFNAKNKVVSDESSKLLQDSAKGQLALLMTSGDWLAALKIIKEFAKQDESVIFRAGLIDGVVYEAAGLNQLADLPSREEIIARLLRTFKAPQSRLVYGLQFNSMKLVNVLKNASEKGGAKDAVLEQTVSTN